MSSRQDEIRDAIRSFADQIKPDVDPDQASPGPQSVHNEYPPLQRAENGSFVIHVGDAMFGKGPVDPDKAHHASVMSRSEPVTHHDTLAYKPNLKLLIVSVFLWFFGIIPLYIARFLPQIQHHWFDGLGFLSLFLAAAITVLGLLDTRR